MAKFFKWTLIILAGFALLLIVGFKILHYQTKKYSPEEMVTYKEGGNEMDVFYNRPYKKGREIFGGLVPFGVVWRTGANEATTFSTKKNIDFAGKKLPAGNYTLWTIPGPEVWTIILNGKQYSWGVNSEGQASRDPAFDVLSVEIPVTEAAHLIEQFTIVFEGSGKHPELVLSWEHTTIHVPLNW